LRCGLQTRLLVRLFLCWFVGWRLFFSRWLGQLYFERHFEKLFAAEDPDANGRVMFEPLDQTDGLAA
jgi:hypothetical protein